MSLPDPSRKPGGDGKPLVVITGAAGDIGSALATTLARDYIVIGLDQPGKRASVPLIGADLRSGRSVRDAFDELRERFGSHIASVIHLAAYFDFTGEDKPLYRQANVDGTRFLLRALQSFEVEQLVYSGTMLVHEAGAPGERRVARPFPGPASSSGRPARCCARCSAAA